MGNKGKAPKLKSEKAGILQWMRSVGIASIALGGFGILKDFFTLSVCLVYFGLFTLIVDLGFEKFSRFDKVRFVIIAFLLFAGFSFTRWVVFYDDPLDYVMDIFPEDGAITVTFYDESDNDYQDLDITLHTLPPTLIDSVRETTGVAGVQIFELGGIGTPAELPSGSALTNIGGQPYATARRVRCAAVPHQSHIQYKITPKLGESMAQQIHVTGSYKGRFRTRSLDFTAQLRPTSYGIFNKQQPK